MSGDINKIHKSLVKELESLEIQAGSGGYTYGSAVYFDNSGNGVLGVADTDAAARTFAGIAEETKSVGETGVIRVTGTVTNAGWNWNIGDEIWASPSVPGGLTTTASGSHVYVGKAVSATKILLNVRLTNVAMSQIVLTMTAGETLNEGDWVYQDTGTQKVLKLLATSTDDTQKLLGVVVSTSAKLVDEDVEIMTQGLWNASSAISGPLGQRWLSDVSAGAMVSSAPVGAKQIWLGVKISNSQMVVRVGGPYASSTADMFKQFLRIPSTGNVGYYTQELFPYVDGVNSNTEFNFASDGGYAAIPHNSGELRIYKVEPYYTPLTVSGSNIIVKIAITSNLSSGFYEASLVVDTAIADNITTWELCRIFPSQSAYATFFDTTASTLLEKTNGVDAPGYYSNAFGKFLKGKYLGGTRTHKDVKIPRNAIHYESVSNFSTGIIDQLIVSGKWLFASFDGAVLKYKSNDGYSQTVGTVDISGAAITDILKILPYDNNRIIVLGVNTSTQKHKLFSVYTGAGTPYFENIVNLTDSFSFHYEPSSPADPQLIDMVADGLYIHLIGINETTKAATIYRIRYRPEWDATFNLVGSNGNWTNADSNAFSAAKLCLLHDEIVYGVTKGTTLYLSSAARPKLYGLYASIATEDEFADSTVDITATASSLGMTPGENLTLQFMGPPASTEIRDPNAYVAVSIQNTDSLATYNYLMVDSSGGDTVTNTAVVPDTMWRSFPIAYGGGYLNPIVSLTENNNSYLYFERGLNPVQTENISPSGIVNAPYRGPSFTFYGQWGYSALDGTSGSARQTIIVRDSSAHQRCASSVGFKGLTNFSGSARLNLPVGYYFEDLYNSKVVYCPGVPTPDVYGKHYLGYSNGREFYVGQYPTIEE